MKMKGLWSLLLGKGERLYILMNCFVKLLMMVLWFVRNVAKRCCCVSKRVDLLRVWEPLKNKFKFQLFEMQ